MFSEYEVRIKAAPSPAHKLWLRLYSCTNLVEHELRNRFRTHYNSTLPRFYFLAQLSRNPEGLKMGVLSHRLMVSNGNITVIANQLEKENLIIKFTNAKDRRSSYLKLTQAGQQLFDDMYNSYCRWVDELFEQVQPPFHKKSFEALSEVSAAIKQTIMQQQALHE
ncbi:MarR family winged helix-turn-helix transcriptional regulator [Brackiella oedipodis]|uniref:MarR family winged helix-turn-helix transcriptional regulator n=1 Tax=Brackiella oedipodis TaxID=124225 RepID=UPI0004920FB3|nr:MarR family transcriptional regulator [Brackiella oedipodis]